MTCEPLGTYHQKKNPLVRLLGGFFAALPAPARLAPSVWGAFGGRGRLPRPGRGCLGGVVRACRVRGQGRASARPRPLRTAAAFRRRPRAPRPPRHRRVVLVRVGSPPLLRGRGRSSARPCPRPRPARGWRVRVYICIRQCLHLYSPVFTVVAFEVGGRASALPPLSITGVFPPP